jgi:hypothetical protein
MTPTPRPSRRDLLAAVKRKAPKKLEIRPRLDWQTCIREVWHEYQGMLEDGFQSPDLILKNFKEEAFDIGMSEGVPVGEIFEFIQEFIGDEDYDEYDDDFVQESK